MLEYLWYLGYNVRLISYKVSYLQPLPTFEFAVNIIISH